MSDNNTIRERVARMEEKTDNIDKKLDLLISKFDNLETSFVTRREFSIAKWLIAIGFSVVGVVLATANVLKG